MSQLLVARLHKIEGQIRGIEGMVEDGRDCHEVVQQVAAVKAAIDQVAILLLHDHARECLRHAAEMDEEHHDAELRRMARAYRAFARS